MSEQRPERSEPRRSNLRPRILSAIVIGSAALGFTVLGGMAFRLFAAAMALLVFHEWLSMRPALPAAHRFVAWGLLALVLVLIVAGAAVVSVSAAIAIVIALVLVHGVLAGAGWWVGAGLAYALVPTLALAFLRGSDVAGLAAILFLFAVVWATDIGAFFVGRALGGPKLAPAISPGKTWSGAVGGTVVAVLAGVLVHQLAGAASPVIGIGVLALVLSAVSQLGDLFESAVKRRHGVKDSGTIIPGHGGVMDRVDGLVAAAVVLYAAGALYTGAADPAAGFFTR